MDKTNAMRQLETAGVKFRVAEYTYQDDFSGEDVAERINLPPEQVFKTLIARGAKRGILVFCIPVNCELDLKKAARAAGDKAVEMTHVKELLGLSGYIRGGVSPVGMKKKYPTYIDETAVLFDELAVSAGVRGLQMICDPEGLIAFAEAAEADLCV